MVMGDRGMKNVDAGIRWRKKMLAADKQIKEIDRGSNEEIKEVVTRKQTEKSGVKGRWREWRKCGELVEGWSDEGTGWMDGGMRWKERRKEGGRGQRKGRMVLRDGGRR